MIGRAGAKQRGILSLDLGRAGRSQTEGLALFDAQGEPGQQLRTMSQQPEQIEIARTRELGRPLVDKDLLREMRFDADLLALHRHGVMGLVYAHLVSMGNQRKRVQWRIDAGTPAAAPDQAAASPAPS